MKERELREVVKCGLCGKKVGESGVPLFWRVKIERYGIDLRAVERQQGLTMMLGGHAALAMVMGPNEDLAKPMMEPVSLTVCETCCTKNTCVAAMAEMA